MIRQVVLIALLFGSQVSVAKTPLEWRQEYNEVVAAIDTLMRVEGTGDWNELDRHRPTMPEEVSIILIFWADDEAEVFINGYRVAQTRLTPVQVEVPKLYLREQNVIQAHCWDTDGVESGFMAGLYIRDEQGRLRPVLVTDEGPWRTDENALAEVRFYSNDLPDIPGAYVIWGDGLYGEVWLEAEFSADSIRDAGQRRPVEWDQLRMQPMHTHQVISRIVGLQSRQKELKKVLNESSYQSDFPRYNGYVTNRLAFSLGRAGRLAESENQLKYEALQKWVDRMPPEEQMLIFRPPRPLKGVEAATARQPLEVGETEEKGSRRKDYLPPAERGKADRELAVLPVSVSLDPNQNISFWWQWTVLFGLVTYAVVLGRSWWQLYSDEVWRQ